MNHAIVLHATGPAENLRFESVPVPVPGPGQAVVRHEAVGVNYIDVYMRNGLYALPSLPAVIGMEGAGVVTAVGDGVVDVAVGDRVAYCGAPAGAYAELRLMPADRLVRLPPDISTEAAAALMLKGMTAAYLLFRTVEIQPGDTILVHAAAGGVGLILCSWAKRIGATVIGTVGSDEKAEMAREHGCDHPVVYTRENFRTRVTEITSGQGVRAVYDSVGRTTLHDSCACVATFGHVVSFGQSSGMAEPVPTSLLAPKSAYLSRPTLFHHIATRVDLLGMAQQLFDAVRSDAVPVRIGGHYPLSHAAQAHRDLEARRTRGSLLLVP